MKTKIEFVTLNDYLSDYDNLAQDTPEWYQRLKEAVVDYNHEFKTSHNWNTAIRKYKDFKINKILK